MSVQDAAVSADPALSPADPLRLRTLLLLATAVLGCGALLVAATGVDRVDGAHDRAAQVLVWLATTTAPLVGFVGLFVAAVDVVQKVREGRARRQVAPAVAVAALSAAVLAACVLLSPLAGSWLD